MIQLDALLQLTAEIYSLQKEQGRAESADMATLILSADCKALTVNPAWYQQIIEESGHGGNAVALMMREKAHMRAEGGNAVLGWVYARIRPTHYMVGWDRGSGQDVGCGRLVGTR